MWLLLQNFEDVRAHALILVSVVINTLIAGPVVSHLVRHGGFFSNNAIALEGRDTEDELRMLACVYSSRQVSATLGFVSALSGGKRSSISPYLMHLVELPQRLRRAISYHETRGTGFSDDDDYGGNEIQEINNAVDAFAGDTKILVHQMKVVSLLRSLYEDVCNGVEDLRTSILLVPFHKHQRIDGTMVHSKEGIRTTNQKVIRHCPCTIGIIVDRGRIRVPHLLVCDTPQHVAVLFFGGPDDREALAWSQRFAMHPKIELTIVRFLEVREGKGKDYMSGISREREAEIETDNVMLADIVDRY